MSALRSDERFSVRIARAAAVLLSLSVWTSAAVAVSLAPHFDRLLVSLVVLGFAPFLICTSWQPTPSSIFKSAVSVDELCRS